MSGALDQLVRATTTVPASTDFASAVGTPIVVDRDTARAYILSTGDVVSEITPAHIVSVMDPEFGAKGDGVTDDTAAVLTACAAVAAIGGTLVFPAGNYLFKSTLALTSSHANLKWNLQGATISKGFNGDLITLTNCDQFAIDGVGTFDGVMTSFTGKGFVVSGTCQDFYIGPGIITKAFAGTHVEYGASSGFRTKLMCNMFPDASQATPIMITVTGTDASAMQRDFWGQVIGTISLTGALSTTIRCPLVNQISIDSTCSVTIVAGCSWSNNGNPITIDGGNTIILGCRMAGDVTINAGTTGAYVGNRQTTANRLINNSTTMTVITEWVMTMPDGTASLPGLVWRNNPATGLWQRTGNVITFSLNGADQIEFSPSSIAFESAEILRWGNSSTISGIGAFDTGIAKAAAGIVEINNGTAGTIAKIKSKFQSSDASDGISTTITTAGLVGKTITVKDGIITGFA